MTTGMSLGRIGELLAADYLERQGHRIIERNWRCRWGEIDIVSRISGVTVFVEVKTRSDHLAGHPFDALSRHKLGRLRRLAGAWCAEHPHIWGDIRIDAVAVTAPHDAPAVIEHLESVTA